MLRFLLVMGFLCFGVGVAGAADCPRCNGTGNCPSSKCDKGKVTIEKFVNKKSVKTETECPISGHGEAPRLRGAWV